MNLAPELRLLLCAIRNGRHGGEGTELAAAAAGPIDWAVLARGAQRHGLSSALLAQMEVLPGVPPAALHDLRRRATQSAAGTLARVRETVRITNVLRAAGLRFLVIKGVPLSVQLYGDPAARDARDIDIVVDGSQIDQAGEVLRSAGYQDVEGDLSAREVTDRKGRIKEIQFFNPELGIVAELHHRLTDNRELLAWDFEMLWRERETVSVLGSEIPTLSRPRLAPYLCLHGAIHCWQRLLWLGDLEVVVGASDTVAIALDQARDLKFEPLMFHAATLAQDWLGIAGADADRPRRSIRHFYLNFIVGQFFRGARWHEGSTTSVGKQFLRYSVWLRLYRYGLKSDWLYWRRELSNEFDSASDRKVFQLPERLRFLYPAIRPAGWLIRRIRR